MLGLGSQLSAAYVVPFLSVGDATSVHTLEQRASSCTFNTASAVASGKKSCSTITLDNIEVPAGETLDLTGLSTGTQVRSCLLFAPLLTI